MTTPTIAAATPAITAVAMAARRNRTRRTRRRSKSWLGFKGRARLGGRSSSTAAATAAGEKRTESADGGGAVGDDRRFQYRHILGDERRGRDQSPKGWKNEENTKSDQTFHKFPFRHPT
ncbi:MAG: hypothetical protein ACI9KE_001744 [Polyangiales bacterium]|jgi:hypothetical protein